MASEDKAAAAAALRSWRKRNPELARAADKRKMEKIKNDPEKLERHRAYRRGVSRANRAANPERERRYRRHAELRKKYGMEASDYEALLAAQNGVCAICGRGPSGSKKYLCVDHDHATGEVRGLLCDSCNRAIGLIGDDPNSLQAAADYLRNAAQKGDLAA